MQPDTLTPDRARELTDRIKVAVEGTWLLIQEAYTTRAWATLGYASWDEYCSQEFGTTRLRLPREERQEVVASLRESGLSVRAIASATSASVGTVAADLGRCSEMNTSVITGTDGKTYANSTPRAGDDELLHGADWIQPDDESASAAPASAVPAPDPAPARRRPLPEAFADAGRDLARAAERLNRLTTDDRFTRNRDQIHQQVPQLIEALRNAVEATQAMTLAGAQASEEARRWWATSLRTISDALRDVANSLEQEK